MFPPEPKLEVEKEKKPLKQDTAAIQAMKTFEHKIEQVSNLVEKTQLADEHNQFEAVLESNGISTFIPADNTTIENEIIIENINPMTVFRELENEKSETTIDVRNVNKNLQKQRLANENQIFRDAPKTGNSGKSFSLSRCWKDVQTGHVRNKATHYLTPGENQLIKSPSVKRRQINWMNGNSDSESNTATNGQENSKTDNPVPWRRKESSSAKAPSLNLVGVKVTPVTSSVTQQNVVLQDITETSTKISRNLTKTDICDSQTPSQQLLILCPDQDRIPTNERESSKSPRKSKKEEVEEELDETIKALEQHVVNYGSIKSNDIATSTSLVTQAAVSVRDAAGAVREVAQNILKALTPERQMSVERKLQPKPDDVDVIRSDDNGAESEEEEDMSCYDDDFSMGIDLPMAAETSGNVTPIPTTGELEELSSVDEPTIIEVEVEDNDIKQRSDSRATPLKSLLKKPSFEVPEPSSSDTESDDDGKISPKKVHFSEIDQVKLMSQESLASMAASEGYEPTILNSLPTSIQCPSVAKIVNNKMLSEKQEELEKAMGNSNFKPHQTYGLVEIQPSGETKQIGMNTLYKNVFP